MYKCHEGLKMGITPIRQASNTVSLLLCIGIAYLFEPVLYINKSNKLIV